VPETMKVIEGGVEEQTRQALANLTEVIKAGGSDLANVVKCTVFIKNMVSYPIECRVRSDGEGSVFLVVDSYPTPVSAPGALPRTISPR